MQDIESFVSAYDNSLNVEEAWKNYWKDKGISIGNGIPKYSNDIKDIPHSCIYNKERLEIKDPKYK